MLGVCGMNKACEDVSSSTMVSEFLQLGFISIFIIYSFVLFVPLCILFNFGNVSYLIFHFAATHIRANSYFASAVRSSFKALALTGQLLGLVSMLSTVNFEGKT